MNTKNYSIYVGLNDRDQKIQLISTLEAAKITQKLVCKFFGGGTIYETDGVYTHENGAIVIEKTLKIELIWIDDVDNVNEFIKTLKTIFNQESILVKESVELVKFA